MRLSIDEYRSADDGRVAIEALLPQALADQEHARVRACELFASERSAVRRAQSIVESQQRHDLRRDPLSLKLCRETAAAQHEVSSLVGTEDVEAVSRLS